MLKYLHILVQSCRRYHHRIVFQARKQYLATVYLTFRFLISPEAINIKKSPERLGIFVNKGCSSLKRRSLVVLHLKNLLKVNEFLKQQDLFFHFKG